MFRTTILAFVTCAAPAFAQDGQIGFGGRNFDSTAAIEVSAENLSLDQSKGRAELIGDVAIAQGALRLSAERMIALYEEANGRQNITRITASGDVLIVAGEDAAQGDMAVYETATGMIKLTGNVLVTQGQSAVSGESLILDLKTGSGSIKGRVRTTFGGAQ